MGRLVLVLGMLLLGWAGVSGWAEKPGVPPQHQETAGQAEGVTYSAEVRIEPEERLVTGRLVARLQPPEDDVLYFHLYPNAFQEENNLNGENWQYLLGDNRLPGELTVQDVRIRGKTVPFRLTGEGGTLLEVSLPPEGEQEEAAEVELDFVLQVPRNNGRLSYNDHAIWLGNWLPILAVHEAGGWRLDPYYPMGDPFYSQTAQYRVTVTVPAGYQVATSGTETQAVVTEWRPAGGKRYEIDAVNVRDFAMVVMDETYRVETDTVGDLVIKTWWQEGDDPASVRRLHETAKASLVYFSKQFGAYPYAEYDVVKTGGFFGGMEYPGLVFIQHEFFAEPDDYGPVVVAHETAHQWFYGLVGNDEVREAWVDESLTDYATMAFLQAYDPKLAKGYIDRRTSKGEAAVQYAEQGISSWQPLGLFPDWRSYSDLVYSRGATAFWRLRETWGEERVNRTLARYVEAHRFGVASGQDVVAAFSETAQADATPFFAYWFQLQTDQQEAAEAWMEAGKRNSLLQWLGK